MARLLEALGMTVQISDTICHYGRIHPLFSVPLESCWKQRPRPENFESPVRCTACWRGYVAKWAIENHQLFLLDISWVAARPLVDLVKEIFPESNGKVLADWFSGELCVPLGRIVSRSMFLGPGFVCEYELIIQVSRGCVVKEKVVKTGSDRKVVAQGPDVPGFVQSHLGPKNKFSLAVGGMSIFPRSKNMEVKKKAWTNEYGEIDYEYLEIPAFVRKKGLRV